MGNNEIWKKRAEMFLKSMESKKAIIILKPIFVLVKWRNNTYFGLLQNIFKKCPSRIFYLSKNSKPLPKNFLNALKKIKPDIKTVQADDKFDLIGEGYCLRRVGNQLLRLTQGQTNYILSHPPKEIEKIF